jgi:predicted ester cyclase
MIGRSLAAALAVALAVTVSSAARADDAANEALARQYYAAVNSRAFASFADFVASEFVNHADEAVGIDALAAQAEALVAEMSDMRMSIELILPSGDYVTVVGTARGTAGGAMPADQRVVEFRIVDVWLIRDGKLAELWRADTM